MINKRTRPSFSAYSTASQTVNHKMDDECKSGSPRVGVIFLLRNWESTDSRVPPGKRCRKIRGKVGKFNAVGLAGGVG